MPPPTDEDAALAAIATLNELTLEQQDAKTKIDTIIQEEGDSPFVDIHELFALYDVLYFRSLLGTRVEVTWSSRLTLCAGMCEISNDDEGKFRRIRLKMSEPLLKYRTRSDTINTLLHEAIHAYFFITTSWRHARGDDGTGHGNGFLLLADAISNHGSYEITVYHTFHGEVDSYRTHIWKCDGVCQDQPPFFGLVKRSMNRPPSKSDPWWSKHLEECGGTYTKISEPGPTKAQLNTMSAMERAGRQKNKIDVWIRKPAPDNKDGPAEQGPMTASVDRHSDSLQVSDASAGPLQSHRMHSAKRGLVDESKDSQPRKKVQVNCPICNEGIDEAKINQHLDTVHLL